MDTVLIELKYLGDKTEARCTIEKLGKVNSWYRWGRNGVEAVSKMVVCIQRNYGRGVEYEVIDTPIRGKT